MSETQALIPLADIEKMASAVASSKLFGCKTKDEAIAMMLVAQAEGMHPMRAVQEFHIIRGRPSRKAEAMLARFQAAGGTVRWITLSEKEATAAFSHPQGGEVTISWTIGMAAAIKNKDKDDDTWKPLTDKKVWKDFPRAMLRSRCISEGVRSVYPGATGGMYTPEEVEDMGSPKDMGDADVIQPPRAKSEKPKAEDIETVEPAKPAAAASAKPAPPNPAQADKPMNIAPIGEGPRRLIEAKMKQASITEAELCKHFNIEKLADLKMAQLNDALAWLANPSGTQ